ncbi:hypothetical protein HGA64_02985 [Candidatus Falkowbacteria bacterium]|nr:hypothetical protein [Candidatus Falkowbacteria bacterium]
MLEDSRIPEEGQQPSANSPIAASQSLDKNQKIFLVILVLFAMGMLGMWAMQFRKSLTAPFDEVRAIADAKEKNRATTTDTSNFDTDKDGLTDEEELGNYHTSPYLEDTDADGINDGDEVSRGSDPLCAEGRDCSVVAPATSTPAVQNITQASATSSQTQVVNPASTSTTSANGLSDTDMQQMLTGGMDAKALRQALLKSGADPKLMDQLSDEQLMQSYQQSLKQQQASQ